MLGVFSSLRRVWCVVTPSYLANKTIKQYLPNTGNWNVTASFSQQLESTKFKDANEELIDRAKRHISLPEDEATKRLDSLTGDDRKRLDIIKLEYEVSLASGSTVPETVTDSMWWDLYTASSESRRKRIFRYFAENERSSVRKLQRKAESRRKQADRPEPLTRVENGFQYNLNPDGGTKNTIFLKILKTTMDKHYYNNIYQSTRYGSQLVFDMSYDRYMRPQDITNTIDQLLECHGFNKLDKAPFYTHFCNLKAGSESYKRFERSTTNKDFPGKTFHEYPFTVTDKCYLDLFPKERLVYLTPQAPNMLETFDPNDVYIIGGLVDKVVTKPVTFAKAKRQGLRMAKFPFDLYLKWVVGSKSITLDQAMKILLAVKNTGDWRRAFEHVPKRKRQFFDEI